MHKVNQILYDLISVLFTSAFLMGPGCAPALLMLCIFHLDINKNNIYPKLTLIAQVLKLGAVIILVQYLDG